MIAPAEKSLPCIGVMIAPAAKSFPWIGVMIAPAANSLPRIGVDGGRNPGRLRVRRGGNLVRLRRRSVEITENNQ